MNAHKKLHLEQNPTWFRIYAFGQNHRNEYYWKSPNDSVSVHDPHLWGGASPPRRGTLNCLRVDFLYNSDNGGELKLSNPICKNKFLGTICSRGKNVKLSEVSFVKTRAIMYLVLTSNL